MKQRLSFAKAIVQPIFVGELHTKYSGAYPK